LYIIELIEGQVEGVGKIGFAGLEIEIVYKPKDAIHNPEYEADVGHRVCLVSYLDCNVRVQ
jgi:hypothetical protein